MFSKFLADDAKTRLFELRDKLDVSSAVSTYNVFNNKRVSFRNMKIILNDQPIHLKI